MRYSYTYISEVYALFKGVFQKPQLSSIAVTKGKIMNSELCAKCEK